MVQIPHSVLLRAPAAVEGLLVALQLSVETEVLEAEDTVDYLQELQEVLEIHQVLHRRKEIMAAEV
jgi:hypothetical protein